MGDAVYIEPAGDDDDYEDEDYSSIDDHAGRKQLQQNWHQTRHHAALGGSSNDTHSTVIPSLEPPDAADQPYIRLSGLLPNLTKNEGELLRLKCNAAGALPIDFRWYKNDAPLLKEKNRVVVKNRNHWSRLRITRLEPLDQAFYRCEASNKAGVVKTTSLVQVKTGKYRSNGDAPLANGASQADDQSVDGDDESTFFKPFTCQEYSFEACRDYLAGKKIFIHSKNLEDIRDIDRRLRAAFVVISNSSQVSDECKEYAARAACYHSYQICDTAAISSFNGHRNGGSRAAAPIQHICKDDCERLEEEICPQEYETARSQNLIGRGKDQILPNCRDLPNDAEKCLRVVDGTKKHSGGSARCYVGNGKTYRGAVSTTIAGRPCASWADASRRHPLFSPSRFPELKNNNYCRNPGGRKPQPWCFTGDGVEEYCDVPKCISGANSGLPDDGIDAGVMTIPSEYMQYVLLAAGILGVLLLAVLMAVVCYCLRSRRKANGKAKKTTMHAPIGSVPSLGASRPLMNSHQHHPHMRHHHYCGGMIGNGIRKPVAAGQQMELYSLLSPSTGPMSSPAAAPSSMVDGLADIPSGNIRYVEVLGEGQFSKLWRSELTGYATTTTSSSDDCGAGELKHTQIAVKALKEDATVRQRQEFEHEVMLKGKLKHPNVVELIGVSCMRTSSSTTSTADIRPTSPCMIFEFMMHGDLNAFLLLRSPFSQAEALDSQRILLDHSDFLHIATQISAGMEYLASQHYVHRDLASRNCLVFDRLTIKVADFGIPRDAFAADYCLHQSSKNGMGSLLPLRWMSPEAIMYGKYSEASDVWSFGITMWEIYSYGKQPFDGCSNSEIVELIRQRCLPPCPDKCPPQMYSLMMECWNDSPSRRPRFVELHARLRTWSLVSTTPHSASQSVATSLTAATTANFCPPPSAVPGENLSSGSDRSSCCSSTNSSGVRTGSRIRMGVGTRPTPVGGGSVAKIPISGKDCL